ncbi:hypothetical protein YC2023_109937 [Brassica napus]
MTKLKPNKKENKSKTSEEPTPRKSQQEVLSMSTFYIYMSTFCFDQLCPCPQNMGGGYWWLELSWCLDGHGSFHPNPSELRRLCSFEDEDVNSLCSLSSNALKALYRNKDIEK